MYFDKVFGGAGCGKTYYLVSELTSLLESGTLPRDIGMVTMTRNAAGEFKNRVIDVIGAPSEYDLRWFGTMHSIAWKMAGLKPENMAKSNLIKNFNESIHLGGDPALAKKLLSLDSARRSCMQPCDEKGFAAMLVQTGNDTGYKDGRSGRWKHSDMSTLVDYGEKFHTFLGENGVYDFTGCIEVALQMLKDGSASVQFSNLFADEFQDFSPLQHELFWEIKNQVDHTWACGDDLQTIFRFSGATPYYMLNDPCDRETVLPKTHRYGDAILVHTEKYISYIRDKKDRVIESSGAPGSVSTLYGNEWVSHIHESPGTTAYLVRTNAEVKEITSVLDNKGIIYALLGTSQSTTEGLLAAYNIIAKLHGGDRVPSEDIFNLISAMSVMIPSGDSDVSGKKKQQRVIKRGVKSNSADMEWFFQTFIDDWYTAESFAIAFLQSETWNLKNVASSVKGLVEFVSKKHLSFPTPAVDMITDFVGTIHKFKGNEADNVFLYTQIPFSVMSHIKTREAVDDELRLFYVGASRARTNLYEVKGYFSNSRGVDDDDIDDVIKRWGQ